VPGERVEDGTATIATETMAADVPIPIASQTKASNSEL
jgi:hypothetical protein